MLKVMTIVGTRPEIIRLSRVMASRWSRRQRSIWTWWPDISGAGTPSPRHCSGRV